MLKILFSEMWCDHIKLGFTFVVIVRENLFLSSKFCVSVQNLSGCSVALLSFFNEILANAIMTILLLFFVCSPKKPKLQTFSSQSAHCFLCVRPQSLLNIIASVLHLGNAQFGEGEEGETYITTEPQINNLAKVRTVLLVFPDVQICGQSYEEPRLRTDVLLFCSCWLLMAVLSGKH